MRHRVLLVLSALCLSTHSAGCQPPIFKEIVGNPGDNLGRTVDGDSDVNADGVPDYVMGTWLVTSLTAGQAYVYSGATHSLIYTFTGVPGFGTEVAMAGDVNNDGYGDILVGSPEENSFTGAAYVYSGQSGAVLYSYVGNNNSAYFGQTLDGAGDVNNDGFADFIIGAASDNTAANNAGQVKVYSGQNGSVLYTFNGPYSDAYYGTSLAGVGDVNNDGYDDIAIGRTISTVYVHSGFNGSILYTIPAPANFGSANFGHDIDGAGDINHDGYADIIVGIPSGNIGGTDTGSSIVFSGFDASALHTVSGTVPYESCGEAVAGVGDVDGDSFDDFACGGPYHSPSGGIVRIFSGATGNPLEQLTINGGGQFGGSLAPAGDINGDGFTEIIASGRYNSIAGPGTGKVVVFTLCGAMPYGLNAGPLNNLTLGWVPGTIAPSIGTISITGGISFSPGVLAVASSPDNQAIGGHSLLVNLTPGSWFGLPFMSGAGGVANFPVDLRTAGLRGGYVFLQGLEDPGGGQYRLSNGLAIRFCP